jgi:hypothetical protein
MPESNPKKNSAKLGHSPMFCGNTSPIYFKRHTAKRLSKCAYEVRNRNQKSGAFTQA